MGANMNDAEFQKDFNGVNGPSYRGAPYPPFDKYAINESAFDDELRYKNCDFEVRNGILYIDWISQEWADPHGKFDNEVRRCLNAIGFKGDVVVNIASRDGFDDEQETYTFSVF